MTVAALTLTHPCYIDMYIKWYCGLVVYFCGYTCLKCLSMKSFTLETESYARLRFQSVLEVVLG